MANCKDFAAPVAKKRCQSGGKFKASWNIPPEIIASSKGEAFAYCKLCMRHFSVAHGGLNDVTRHVKGPTHLQRVKDSSTTVSLRDMLHSTSYSQLSHTRKVTNAEVMMSNFIALHNLSFQTADHFSRLVSSMFPDSAIAADFSCGHTKTKAIISKALDPYHKKTVINSVCGAPFSLLCDESNERGDSVKLLTILIRFFDSECGSVVCRHLDTVGMTAFGAVDIFEAIKNVLDKYGLSFRNLIAFASDTCNVMKGVRNGVISKICHEQPKVFDVHCVCHLLNLCVKSAIKVLPLKIDEVLVDIYYHFHCSVKSVVSLKEYADFCDIEFKKVLKHSETRWLSLTRSIKRTLEMWEPLLSYFTSHHNVEKPGKVKSIYENLTSASLKTWMLFLSNVMVIFDKFNVYFQTSKTATVHKLFSESERLLKTVLSFFVKSSIIKENLNNLVSIEYFNSSNQLSDEELFIGDETTAFLLNLTENEGFSVNDFFLNVRSFYVAFTKKIISKFDFKSSLLRTLKLLDPMECQNVSVMAFDNLRSESAVPFDKGVVKLEYREFVIDDGIAEVICEDAVAFWLKVKSMKTPMGDYKYQHLSNVALHLLAIPASNADCERVFSLVRRIKTDFRSSLLPETVSALIGIHFNSLYQCCEQSEYKPSFLDEAKSCTHSMNIEYSKK